MNIFGTNLYSKAIQGLRQQKIINNQQTQLIYIYPIFVDEKLAKIYQDISSFLSVNMLKEIFVQNSLNLINVAASVHTMEDELNSNQPTYGLFGGGGGGGQKMGSPVVSKNDNFRNETQRRINEKTAELINILKSDPVFQKYNPYLKMITMENYVDVPVIIGTKQMNLNNSLLFLFLLIALVRKIPLTTFSNVKSIFSIMKSLTPHEFYNLMHNLENQSDEASFSFKKLFGDLILFIPRKIITTDKKYFPNRAIYQRTNRLNQLAQSFISSKNNEDSLLKRQRGMDIDRNSTYKLLELIKQNMVIFESGWNKCFDADRRSSELGVPANTNSGTKITSLVSNDLQKIIEKLFLNLTNDFNRVLKPEIISIACFFYSSLMAVRRDPYTDVTKYISTDLLPKLDTHVFDDLHLLFKNIIDEKKINELQSTIDSLVSKANLINSDFSTALVNNPVVITSEIFDGPMFISARDRIRQLDALIKSLNDQYSRLFNAFFGNDVFNKVILNFTNVINSSISQHIIPSPAEYGPKFQHFSLLEKHRPGTGISDNNPQVTIEEQFNALVVMCQNYLNSFIKCIFFHNLHKAIKEYITIIEVNLDLAKTEVTDDVNFSMILSEDMILMLCHTIFAYSWKSLVDNSQPNTDVSFARFVTQKNIKKLVEYLCTTLQIPNLFVLASNQENITYKLMHRTDILTTNLSTMKTFISMNNKTLLPSQNNNSYYY